MQSLLLALLIAIGVLGANAAQSESMPKQPVERLAANERYTYHQLLASQDHGLIRLAARTLINGEVFDEAMLDVVAERLLQAPTSLRTADNIDAMSWFAKVLGASGNGRYRPLLQSLHDQAGQPKLRKYLAEALAQLADAESAVSYTPGSVDLLELALELERVRAESATMTFDSQAAAPPMRGEALDSIYQRFGLPDYVNDSVIRTGGMMIPGLKLAAMDVYYYNRFVLRLEYSRERDNRGWRVTHYSAELPHAPFADAAERDYLAHGLMVSNSKMLQSVAIELDKSRTVPAGLLDVVAERLLISAETEDDVEVDALSRLCRVLGRTGDLRYAEVLDEVAVKAKDGDLEDYAASFRKRLVRETGTRYRRSTAD